MAERKLTVVISQAQGKNPAKRDIEEAVAARLIMEPGVDVSLVPHLYDMQADHSGLIHLRNVPGDMVVLSWLFPRATRWILDRQNVRGREGVSELNAPDEEPIEDAASQDERAGVDRGPIPQRHIWCLDLREPNDADAYIEEVLRIRDSAAVKLVSLDPMFELKGSPPTNGARHDGSANGHDGSTNGQAGPSEPTRIDEAAPRRWYPVIDYSRCTNCMECIDFCLFGVYGVDSMDQILVESQDSCKKGCPACSRVCPENAIVFPGHKTPAIAGADGEVAGLKLDLSKLFGGDSPADPLALAVAERDVELVADGRDAVGMAVGIPKRQANASATHDELDDLLDGLDV